MRPVIPGDTDYDALYPLFDAFASTAAVTAADELGIFDRLRLDRADAAALARDCAISERGATVLLTALAGIGLVESAGDGSYGVTPFQSQLMRLRDYYGPLAAAIRHDRPIVAADTPQHAHSFYPDVVPIIADLFAPAAERAAEHLAVPRLRVLDVGAGAAPWSLALARKCSDCWVTAVDLPAVLDVTRRSVAEDDRASQFTFLAGDVFSADLGGPYDLAIAGNLCHLFDEAANQRLLARLYHALCPGGKIAIVDILVQEGLDGPRDAALYALGLFLRTSAGRIYPFSTYASWLRNAGFHGIERVDLPGKPRPGLITARRP